LSKLLTKQRVRYACIAVLIAGVFSISDTHADSGGIGESKITVSPESRPLGNDTIGHFNLGVDHQKRGNAIKAIEEYENVLKSDPDNAEAHNNLGAIYKEQGNLDKALEHYQLVITSNPEMDEVHNNLGVIYYLRGDHEEAVEEYRKALELNPDNLMCLINLGLVYKAQGMELKTIDTLETILSIEPFQAEAHYNLAILYEELGHLESAIRHYVRFVANAGSGYPDLAKRVAGHIEDLKVTSGEVIRRDGLGVFPSLPDNRAY
jgi:tetratricopeptide (TPR) repeat protein